MKNQNLHFFLGGADAEMTTIKNLLETEGVSYSDAKLSWGASTSKYGDEIAEVAKAGKTPVIVELTVDSKLPDGTINVDHHNENSSKPASILQVCELLGIEPTRKMQLIAANDCGYIPAMLAMGATKEEINAVRYQDRAAQGITLEQESAAEEALKHTKEMYGVTIVMLSHSKTATITDRLFDATKPQNLLIISADGETNYFGPEDICRKLQGNKVGERPAPWDPNQTEILYDNFGGWTGGAGLGKKGETAFWGGYADQKEILKFVLKKNFEKAQVNTATTEMDVTTKPDIIMERPSITCPYCGRTRYMQGHYGSPASGFTACGCEGEKRAVAESFEKSKREYEKESLERRKSGWHPTTW